MLDEVEFARVINTPRLDSGPIRERFAPMLAEYKRITGFEETNPNAIWHHRISHYGPPCASCGKPFRTAQARRCAECGAVPAPA